MRREVTEIFVGAAVILAAAAFVFGAFSGSGVENGRGYRLSFSVQDASGLASGSEVRMAGIPIGQVEGQSIDPDSFLAEVVLAIDEGIELPLDTSARILPNGFVGDSYVEIEPGGELDLLQDGDTIDFAQGAINVIDLLARVIMSGEPPPAGEESDW